MHSEKIRFLASTFVLITFEMPRASFVFHSTGMHQHLLQRRWPISGRYSWNPISGACAYRSTSLVRHREGTELCGNDTGLSYLCSVSRYSENPHKVWSWCRRGWRSIILKAYWDEVLHSYGLLQSQKKQKKSPNFCSYWYIIKYLYKYVFLYRLCIRKNILQDLSKMHLNYFTGPMHEAVV
jgi:hypothetical protein